MEKMDKTKFMSSSEFCRVYGFTRYKAYELFNNKKDQFPCIKLGSRYYIFRDKVDIWFEQNKGNSF